MKRSKPIESLIRTIRGRKVLIDADLAGTYGVETRTLNQAVKRNAERFPDDFVFRLNADEKSEVITNCDHLALSAIWHKLQPLLQPLPEPPKPRIGFRS